MKRVIFCCTILALLGGCASHAPLEDAHLELDLRQLPPPDTTLKIAGLGPCTDNPDRSLHLDSRQPVNVLVHGCFGSSGQFLGLAQVLAFHGQQTACFTYDDRAELTRSATELRRAIDQLAEYSRTPKITIIGHSQGALIARKSVTELPQTAPTLPAELRLVTISGPFSGIAAAATCGKTWLYPLTLGLLPLSCHVATGAKWADITYSSRFIREPGSLLPQVGNYLKIDTDERDSCRQEKDGRCVESDDIFALSEQRNSLVESDFRTRRVEVRAGHVEIVGDRHSAPSKLIAILQQQGVILPTAPERQAVFSRLLAREYQVLTAAN